VTEPLAANSDAGSKIVTYIRRIILFLLNRAADSVTDGMGKILVLGPGRSTITCREAPGVLGVDIRLPVL
jgi:hypothetical protein